MELSERIWLQEGKEFADDVGIILHHIMPTWCKDKINNDDVEYVRADLFDQLEADNQRLRRELALLKKGWRTGSVDEFLADITTLENEVIRLEDELDKLEAKNKRVWDEMQECHNLLKAPSFDNDGGPTYLPDDIRSLLSIIDALKEGDDAD